MLRITKSADGAELLGVRQFTDAAKDAALATAEEWHEKYLPDRFSSEAAARKYGFQKRSGEGESYLVYSKKVRPGRPQRLIKNPKYFWRKYRETGSKIPNLRTGTAARAAMQSIRLSVRQIKSQGLVRATGVMDVPRYMYQRLLKGTYKRRTYDGSIDFTIEHDTPDKIAELTKVLPDQASALGVFYESAMALRMRSGSGVKVTNKIS